MLASVSHPRIQNLDGNGSAQRECPGGPAHGHPLDEGLAAHLVIGHAAATGNSRSARQGDGEGHAAGVAVGVDGGARNGSARRDVIREPRMAFAGFG